MAIEIDELRANVARNTTVVESAVALIIEIKRLLDAAANMAEVKELSDRLGTDVDKLAAAVVANTPAA